MRQRAAPLTTLGVVVLVLVFGALAGCAWEKPAMDPAEVARVVEPEIDEASIREHLAQLTGASPALLEGEKTTIAERGSESGRKAPATYMRTSFESAGLPARIIEFASGAERGYNVEATLEGSAGEKHLWVTAHMDSVGNAGANDNASGLAMLLMTARALKGLDLEHTVHFVAYDLEEIGLIGSNRYVYTEVVSVRDRDGEEAIVGNINVDMVGYEKDEFNTVVSSCEPTGILDDALERASSAIQPGIALDEMCSDRLRSDSDHAPFMDAGLPAVVVSDGAVFDGYPCYHKTCDTMDELNVAYLVSITRMVATASALLAVPNPEQGGRDLPKTPEPLFG